MKVLDLFCGCGGLSLGLEQSGCEIVLGIDVWEDALRTFERNHRNSKTLRVDLNILDFAQLEKNYLAEGVNLIVGGPPCQGFSISGKRDPNDPRNMLYISFLKAVEHFKPKAFIMENVANLASMNQGKIKDAIVSEFESLGYTISYAKLLASDYGVPQNRRRFILVGLANGKKFDFPVGSSIENKVSCEEAISDLPEYSLIDGTPYQVNCLSKYQRFMRQDSMGVHNHQTTAHTEKTVSIISLVPDGGNYKDLPDELKNTRNVNIAWTRFNSKKPSHTIDTGHRHHFHYKFNRVPTVRESARLQSFPDSFVFLGSKTSQYKQVGNAVPPLLGKVLGEQLIKQIEE